MSVSQTKWAIRSIKGILFLLAMPILLIEAGAGCAEIKTPEPKVSAPSSFSVYALSRGKGVPAKARQVLDYARQVLKQGQEKGEVKRLVERRIGLEGETRLCAEFVEEQVADRFFEQILSRSLGMDLVNIKKEMCPP
ncbi:MAG: hypothetical protein WD425_03255 [Nitrospirales bacterium]